MRDTLGLCDGSHIAFQARQRSATGRAQEMGDRDMKFVTWHSSDGKLGEDDVVPAFLEPKRSWHGLCSNIGHF